MVQLFLIRPGQKVPDPQHWLWGIIPGEDSKVVSHTNSCAKAQAPPSACVECAIHDLLTVKTPELNVVFTGD